MLLEDLGEEEQRKSGGETCIYRFATVKVAPFTVALLFVTLRRLARISMSAVNCAMRTDLR